MKTLKYCPNCGQEIKGKENGSFPDSCENCGLNFKEREKKIEKLTRKAQRREVNYADFFQRVTAFFIDSIIISSLTWIVMSLIHIPIIIQDPIAFYTSFYYFWIAIFLNWVIGFFYCCLLEAYNNGQTIGKKILRICTLDENTFEVGSPEQYAITNLLKTSPFLLIDFIVGFLISDRDSDKILRYLQHLSKTVVIKIKS
ncbi:MAG: RDD family protein [Promethearchaeota archaeon]|nr:MAG: RDD family protein [Candidatus Lokiarchaeota archaeon]